jgi:radical SAM-linked protein
MKIRIKFRKYDTMKYIGHLDLMRFFQKAIRRSGIDIRYTQGFHPHQIMSFALPLGVGMVGDGEYFDIEVNSTESTEDALEKLNAQMADGIDVLNYVLLPDDSKPSMSLVTCADYRYTVLPEERSIEFEALRDRINAYYENRETITVTKKSKKSERILDIKPLIYSMKAVESDGRPAVFLKLSAGSQENIKPELVLTDFLNYFGETFDPYCYERRRLEVYTGSPGEWKALDALGTPISKDTAGTI